MTIRRRCRCDGSPRLCLWCQELARRAGILEAGPPPGISEKAFQLGVTRLAVQGHWTIYHTYNSRRSPAGFPDLVMVRAPQRDAAGLITRPGELIFAELKTLDGVLTLQQQTWLGLLSQVETVDTYLWTPDAMDAIRARLSLETA